VLALLSVIDAREFKHVEVAIHDHCIDDGTEEHG